MLKKLSGYALALIGLTLLFSSCKKEYESIQSVDASAISNYIKANNLTNMVADPNNTGFYYQILNPGTGTNTFKNTDSVLYKTIVKSLANGTTYLDSAVNANQGTFVGYAGTSLTYVASWNINIPAINTVMLQLKPGGSARILLPSYLAFGKNGLNTVPPNENIDLYINVLPEVKQWQADDRVIRAFIGKNALTMTKDPSRVYYSVVTPGTGTDPITANSTVTVKYTGRLLDGTVFDSNSDGVAFALLKGVIKGWTLGITGSKITKGGKIRLLIPSDLAYGTGSSGAIGPNSVLDFDIEITDVSN